MSLFAASVCRVEVACCTSFFFCLRAGRCVERFLTSTAAGKRRPAPQETLAITSDIMYVQKSQSVAPQLVNATLQILQTAIVAQHDVSERFLLNKWELCRDVCFGFSC